MNNEILRNYHLSDSGMLTFAKSTTGYLTEDLAEFTAFDSTITKETLAELKQLLAQTEENVSDSVIIDRQVQLSDEVTKKMNDCILVIRSLSYFVRKAFDSKAVHNEFGLNHFTDVRRSKEKMLLFIRDYEKVANKYKEQLVKSGCNPALIENIGTLYKELDKAMQESELFKGNRPVLTQERIIRNNELWAKVQGISNAAKVIYYDNLPKLKRYMTPKSNSRDQSIKVAAGTSIVGLNNGFDEDDLVEIKNTGKSALTFFVSNRSDAEIPENAKLVQAHETVTVKAEDISDGNYGLLLVCNQTGSESGFIAQLLE